ncbi:MAG TPA: metal ABC transporter substrate-binding protein [Accumulibacter sp.]|nr:metal ABC transporter substrate-binding protein [Accumulibacter sp.]HMW16786.1 metal ABC transporter substrate-binding protein [Accumulibacter sp.]HMX23460.1 metal ABC transporter substrate-binding protein [Accumulibacter sp.]HMY05988.1 metal ABC transporter substrate-binding protein [Accumulibacter sp.]HNC18467.1 metal ABC transporter substrate-binding protein [Accumulibacter sp.]
MRRRTRFILFTRLLSCLWLTLANSTTIAADKLPVVVSFSILADLTQRIGGEHLHVHTLVGPGNDAHVYQPTPADARTLSNARLVIINGLGFEGWIERLVRSAGYRGRVIIASQGVTPLRLANTAKDQHPSPDEHAHDENLDPHAWQDLGNARRYVDNISAALSEIDPTNKNVFQTNAARLRDEIATLDRQIRTTFNSIPAERRKVISSHGAFNYFGRAYGIRFIAPVGINTDAEPSAATVGAIIRQIRQEKIKVLFVENITDPRLLERISRESGARVGGTLYSDSLAKAGTSADSYLGMISHNAKTLAGALTD